MADRFGARDVDLSDPYAYGETADYSSGNYDFTTTTRALNCSADGTLKVDFVGAGTNIAISVVAGLNPYRVTRIYNSGSDSMTVVGLT